MYVSKQDCIHIPTYVYNNSSTIICLYVCSWTMHCGLNFTYIPSSTYLYKPNNLWNGSCILANKKACRSSSVIYTYGHFNSICCKGGFLKDRRYERWTCSYKWDLVCLLYVYCSSCFVLSDRMMHCSQPWSALAF